MSESGAGEFTGGRPSGPTDWRGAILPSSATVEEAITNLEQSGLRIVLVVSAEGKLVGTVTDAEIRRALLGDAAPGRTIEGVMHAQPVAVPAGLSRDTVLDLMRANAVRHLPVVDERLHPVGLHVREMLLTAGERDNVMVIMAGGRGVRLLPHTENCPKPLLPVAGKPMLEHILERAKREGFSRFAIAVQHLGQMIEDYFGDGERWKITIEYIREETPLGTAGALGLLDPRPESPILVTNGDVLTDIRYGELLDFHIRQRAAGTMAVRAHEWKHPFGVVRTSGVDITGFEEKPVSRTHINAGIYVLEPTALDALPSGERCDMPALFMKLHANGLRTIVYPTHEPWLDVGQIETYNEANGR